MEEEEEEESTPVAELLRIPFKKRSVKEQSQIVRAGRPIPVFGPEATRTTLRLLYQKFAWLTGCPVRQKVYCWICLLCAEETRKAKAGFSIRANSQILEEHDNSQGHNQAMIRIAQLASAIQGNIWGGFGAIDFSQTIPGI